MPKLHEARDGAPSRRDLIHGATACAVPLPVASRAADPALLVAAQWKAHEAENRRLIYAWQDRETWLFRHRDWPNLSEAEQAGVPEGALLKTIDHQLDMLRKDYASLLGRLKRTPATTREGVFARFDGLLLFVLEEDDRETAAMLKSCLRDLKRIWARVDAGVKLPRSGD
ncbi:hypothetical protein [Phenylobacterium sp.]|jgi:hypothetical protein|uniref:hypothetical protein n=1 Tax=Phenylobacterium sp. TaxID=1871053 RepID=UPI002F40D9D2